MASSSAQSNRITAPATSGELEDASLRTAVRRLLAGLVASLGAQFFLFIVPDVRARAEFKALLKKKILKVAPQEAAEALTDFIIAEGAAFCKLAQVSAEQPGVVDPVTRDALRKVGDSCKAADEDYILSVLRECIATGNLDCSHFSLNELNPVPLGVGSVAQVHACGSSVIKVALTENLETMEKQAVYLPKMGKWWLLKDTPLANVGKFIEGALRGWRREFNMEDTEGKCLRAFNEWLEKNPGAVRDLRLPEFKTACGRVLVMSRESGTPYKYLANHKQLKCLSTVLELASKSAFEIGMVHCDPHPGNIMFKDGKYVVLLDFGAVLVFDRNQIDALRVIFKRLPAYNVDKMTGESDIANAMRTLGFTTTKDTDRGLARMAADTFDSRKAVPLELMKKGAFGCRDDPPVQCFPPEITPFIRFRSVLSGLMQSIRRSYEAAGQDGGHVFQELDLIKQFSKAARGYEPSDEELEGEPSAKRRRR